MRQSIAVLQLQQAGFELEAAPNQQPMIEHMAKLRHSADHDETGVDSMNTAVKHIAKLPDGSIEKGTS